MKTQTLIEVLVQDAFQGRDLGRSVKTALTIGNVVAGLMFFFAIGPRADVSYAISAVRFLLKFAVTAPMALAATAALVRVGRPGIGLGLPGLALSISPIVLGSALLVEMSIVPQSLWITRMISSNARNCLTLIPFLAMAPLACFLIALRVGAPTRPGLAGAIAGLDPVVSQRLTMRSIARTTAGFSWHAGIRSRRPSWLRSDGWQEAGFSNGSLPIDV